MTKNRSFKSQVRARMAETGERYSTARAHVLAAIERRGSAAGDGSASPEQLIVGGRQPDVAAAANLLANAGVTGPDGQPLSEELAFGLAGGIGFLYGVFEYAEGPTMTIVARNRSMPDPFCEPLFERSGAVVTINTTTGAKKAAADLDRVLDGGGHALCTVGSGGLAYLGIPAGEAAMAPHIVGVVGRDADGLLIDDRAPEPITVDRTEFDRARAAYRQAKHRLIAIDSSTPAAETDWPALLVDAVHGCAEGFNTPPVPQFAANVGLAGLEKWSRLLVDPSDQKRWSKVFASDRNAAIGLTRIHDCIEYAYTSPAAGRPLYADFLDAAAATADQPSWSEAALLLRDSGKHWAAAADIAVDADEALRRYGRLGEQRAAQLDDQPDPDAMAASAAQQAEAVAQCRISAIDAEAAFAAIHDEVAQIVALERQALELLSAGSFH